MLAVVARAAPKRWNSHVGLILDVWRQWAQSLLGSPMVLYGFGGGLSNEFEGGFLDGFEGGLSNEGGFLGGDASRLANGLWPQAAMCRSQRLNLSHTWYNSAR